MKDKNRNQQERPDHPEDTPRRFVGNRAINKKNTEEKNQMPIDVLQDNILEHGIFMSNRAYATIRDVTREWFLSLGMTSNKAIVRTAKFGFEELLVINSILESLPDQLKTGIKSIRKKAT